MLFLFWTSRLPQLVLILCWSEGRAKAVNLRIYLQRVPAVAGGGEFCCCPLFIQSESHICTHRSAFGILEECMRACLQLVKSCLRLLSKKKYLYRPTHLQEHKLCFMWKKDLVLLKDVEPAPKMCWVWWNLKQGCSSGCKVYESQSSISLKLYFSRLVLN